MWRASLSLFYFALVGGHFGHHLRTSACLFIHPLLILLANLISGQVTRSGRDPTSKSICDCAVATVCQRSILNFQELIRVSVPTKRLYRNFDFDGYGSGQFCSLSIIKQRENVRMLFTPKVLVGTCYLSQHFLISCHLR